MGWLDIREEERDFGKSCSGSHPWLSFIFPEIESRIPMRTLLF